MAADKDQVWLRQETDAIHELANGLAGAVLLKRYQEVQILADILKSRARVVGDLVSYALCMEYKKQQEE